MSDIDPGWDAYRTLLFVLEHGSLSAAAREMGLTQPTVGRHIDALEHHLGFPLFTRSPQGLVPTVAALELKPYAQTLAATTAAMMRVASGQRDGVAGSVRISASEIVGIEVLPPILADLQDRYPDLTIELSPSDAVEDLLRREADIAVRMVAPAQDALVVRQIGNIPLGLFAHRRYLDRYGIPQTVSELNAHRLIGFDQKNAFIRTTMERAPELGQLRFAFRVDSNLAQFSAIRAGVGIGFCQTMLARRVPDLVHILPDAFSFLLPTFVAMHENLKTSPRCRVTFDALVAGLSDYIRSADSVYRTRSGT